MARETIAKTFKTALDLRILSWNSSPIHPPLNFHEEDLDYAVQMMQGFQVLPADQWVDREN